MTIKAVLQDPRVKWVLWGLGGILVVYLAIGSWLSKIEISEKKMTLAWETLLQNCHTRTHMLTRYSQLIQSQSPGAQPVITQLNHAYQQAVASVPAQNILYNKAAIDQFLIQQNTVVAALIQTLGSMTNVPAIAQNRQFALMNSELQKVEEQIQFAEQALQKESQFYNYYVTGFPHGWANAVSFRYPRAILFEVPTLEKTLQRHQQTQKAS